MSSQIISNRLPLSRINLASISLSIKRLINISCWIGMKKSMIKKDRKINILFTIRINRIWVISLEGMWWRSKVRGIDRQGVDLTILMALPNNTKTLTPEQKELLSKTEIVLRVEGPTEWQPKTLNSSSSSSNKNKTVSDSTSIRYTGRLVSIRRNDFH